jgi:NADH-quinone oxidoreductase subunit H
MSFWIDPLNFIIEWLRALLIGFGLVPETTQVILYIVGAFLLGTGALLWVMVLIWVERKVAARVQDRFGPNRIGPWGIFQTIADMIKIFTKEHITPAGVDLIPFTIAPVLAVAAVLTIWAIIPFSITFYGTNLNVGVLFVAAVGSLGEMGVILAGWGSNNKYAMLGAFRAVAQLISYSLPMMASLLVPVMLAGSMGMNDIVKGQEVWFVFISPVMALIFFITCIAEVGRAPFDLVEAESELVAGFNIEYSGLKFGMFYVADFLHAFTTALLFATLFLGGWRGPYAEQYPLLGFFYYFIKTFIVYFLTVLIRVSFPRFRIDQMMDINWKLLTPLSLVTLILVSLANKMLAGGTVLRVGVMLGLNVVILVVTGMILDKVTSRKPRPVVSEPRPVARYEVPKPVPETEAGQ